MLKGFEKSLVKTIRATRPNLKQSSVQTYVANLKRLGNMLNLTKHKDLGFLKDTDRVMAALEDYFLFFYTIDARTQRIPPPLYHQYITSILPPHHDCITAIFFVLREILTALLFWYLKKF